MKETIRYIVGYIIGFTLFIIVIPFGLYKLSRLDSSLLGGRVLLDSNYIRYFLSSFFCIVGAIFAIWSNIYLLIVGKGGPVDGFGVSISPQTKKLVTTGPYRYSRNPMVFGAFMIYLSIALFLNSIVGLVCVFIIFTLAFFYLRYSEEKRLLRDFGDDYRDYRRNVSMIFPFLNLKGIKLK